MKTTKRKTVTASREFWRKAARAAKAKGLSLDHYVWLQIRKDLIRIEGGRSREARRSFAQELKQSRTAK